LKEKVMRKALAIIAILALSTTSALAQDATSAAAGAATQVVEAAPAPEPLAPAAAVVEVSVGKTIVTASGTRLGRVSRLDDSGAPQLIFQGRLVTIPVSSLSAGENGRLVTSLSPADLD
jgi:hypothetical protein